MTTHTLSSNASAVSFSTKETLMLAELEHNKRVVRDFLELAFNEGRVEDAVALYVDPRWIEQDPTSPAGPQSLVARAQWADTENLEVRHEIRRIIAEEDLVAVQSLVRFSPVDRGMAVVDIFRVRNSKLVAHWDVWDVAQPVPEYSKYDNAVA
jgi:predicted SnoaL-like aldol condensation-catalyzing enzyme